MDARKPSPARHVRRGALSVTIASLVALLMATTAHAYLISPKSYTAGQVEYSFGGCVVWIGGNPSSDYMWTTRKSAAGTCNSRLGVRGWYVPSGSSTESFTSLVWGNSGAASANTPNNWVATKSYWDN